MAGIIVGSIAGFLVGWLFTVSKTKFTYLGDHYGMFEGPGCFTTLLVEVVCAALGAAVGTFLLS